MPLPIGHALAGLACAQVRPGFFFRNRWQDVFFFVFLANLPDADFLPGIILGHPNLYHHGIFHSVGAALAIAAAGGWFFYLKKQPFWSRAVAIFMVFSSHLLLDFFSWDFGAPFGIPLLWPFVNRYFIAARPIFINVIRSGRSDDFFISLFNRHNLAAAGREIMIMGGVLVAVVTVRCLLKKKRSLK
ncbi:MAG: metal-dependent hydrolase [Candidatus Aminicenantes bacterium]|nr:metal-dependent hydrolase [Candidatus Aminicenantes bacterium]